MRADVTVKTEVRFMMRSSVPALVLVLALVSGGPGAQAVDRSVLDLSERWADFSVRLFRSVAARSDQNLLLSTTSTSSGLSTLLDRTSGTSRDQLDQALNLNGLSQVPDLVSGLRSALGGGASAVGGASFGGVALFSAKGAELGTFRDTVEQKFGAVLTSLDFAGLPVEAADSIERWVLDQTRDRVQIQKQGLDLGPLTHLVLASAQEIQARFSVVFNPQLTVLERFYVDRYRVVMVPMMLAVGKFYLAYDRDLKTGLVRLGLENGSAMLVLFPDEGVHVGALEDQLSAEKIRAWVRTLKKTKLEVQLPRFVLEQSHFLKVDLQKLKVTQVFEDNTLSQVLNAAALTVNDTDTADLASSFKTPPPRLTINRPFLLVVYDEATGAVLMMGRVMDPTQK